MKNWHETEVQEAKIIIITFGRGIIVDLSNSFPVHSVAGTLTFWWYPQSNTPFPVCIQSEHRAESTLQDSFVEEAYSSEKPLWKQRGWGTEFIYFTINYSQQSAWIPVLLTRENFLLIALNKVQYCRCWSHNFTFNNVAQYIIEAQ